MSRQEVTFQLRRDTSANWTADNPVLASGEPGVETDTLLFKLGDGVTTWTALAYVGSNSAALVAAEQTRAVAAEAAITASVTTERVRAIAAETAAVSAVSTETTRALAAESTVSNAVTTESSRAVTAEGVISAAVTTANSRALAAEATISTSVTTETSRAVAAEATVSAAVTAEATRALAAEAALSAASTTRSPSKTPITDNCYTTASSTVHTTTGTSECPHDVLLGSSGLRAATDIVFRYTNHYYSGTADVPNTDNITIKAAARIGSTIYPLTFNGSDTAVLKGGGVIDTDPLPVDVLAGSIVFSRTEVTPAVNWYANHQAQFAPGMGGWTATTGLCVAGAATIVETAATPMYVPSQIYGKPLKNLTASAPISRTALITGDSLGAGSNDYSSQYVGRNNVNPQLSGGGFLQRGLFAAGVPWINAAASGDQATYFNGVNGHNLRWAWASDATTVICEYARNDVSSSRTLAQIQADVIAIWLSAASRGQRVIQTTCTPLTSSTDAYLTTGNQSFNSAQNTVRINFNNWLRDGAPLTSAASLTPVATGTVGALRAGTSGHPLYTYWDAADLAETARDSGIWKVLSSGRTISATIGLSATNLNATDGNFTTADLGSLVTVPGAGAAGANLTAVITARNSATQVTISTASGTAVAVAAPAYINTASTKDGLHPSAPLAILMSAVVVDGNIV